MKQLAPALAALAMIATLEAQTPATAPTTAPAPWLPRPVIVIDPGPYLSSPSPLPARRATPRPKHRTPPRPRATAATRRPTPAPAPETFERIDTAPSPAPHRRAG